ADFDEPITWKLSDGYQAHGDEPPVRKPHFLECEVQRRLLSEPQYQFPSLVVRRLKNGICLEGILITDRDAPDVCELVREIDGVDDIVNRLVICRQSENPAIA
ncbi:MAG: hypothetical protein ACKVT0_08380, partial [Planctomycetaceae bacterium]